MHPPLMVYLPEDDAALLGGPKTIATGGIGHLLERQVADIDHRLAELVTDREALAPQICRWMAVERQGLDALQLFEEYEGTDIRKFHAI